MGDPKVSKLCQAMKNGDAMRQDFEDVGDDSVIWAAIVKLCSQSKLFVGTTYNCLKYYLQYYVDIYHVSISLPDINHR